ncbi:MAG: hypothetical protein ACMXX8_02355 [Candidatus Woesearchaeota archaeon]
MVLADVQIPEEFEDDAHRLLTALGIVGNARINVIDEKNDSVYGVTVVNSKVEEIKFSPVENPNYLIEFSAIAYDAILNAEDPEKEFLNQLNLGNILVKPQGFFEGLNWMIISFLLFFNNLFGFL